MWAELRFLSKVVQRTATANEDVIFRCSVLRKNQ